MLFIAFNVFVELEDKRLNTALNILFASVLFAYISYMAFVLLRKMGKKG